MRDMGGGKAQGVAGRRRGGGGKARVAGVWREGTGGGGWRETRVADPWVTRGSRWEW